MSDVGTAVFALFVLAALATKLFDLFGEQIRERMRAMPSAQRDAMMGVVIVVALVGTGMLIWMGFKVAQIQDRQAAAPPGLYRPETETVHAAPTPPHSAG